MDPKSCDNAARVFFQHSSAERINTDAVIAKVLTGQYPELELVIAPAGGSLDLLGFASAGYASFEQSEHDSKLIPPSLQWDRYMPPSRRIDGALGAIAEQTQFAKYLYKWRSNDFIIYLVSGRDGSQPFGPTNFYILSTDKASAQQLILEAGRWSTELHDEVFVFDEGRWQKSKDLFNSVKKASWDAVILDPDMKEALIEDHLSFFRSRETYRDLQVPWKRGIIYYGPPGNGKTISIKATMNMLNKLTPPVPTLYVRTLRSVSTSPCSIPMPVLICCLSST
jgi:transitional endoplasmic reticulum ATPase